MLAGERAGVLVTSCSEQLVKNRAIMDAAMRYPKILNLEVDTFPCPDFILMLTIHGGQALHKIRLACLHKCDSVRRSQWTARRLEMLTRRSILDPSPASPQHQVSAKRANDRFPETPCAKHLFPFCPIIIEIGSGWHHPDAVQCSSGPGPRRKVTEVLNRVHTREMVGPRHVPLPAPVGGGH